MAEPFKNLFDKELVGNLAEQIENNFAPFDKKKFINTVFDNDWNRKEFKERMHHIAAVINSSLKLSYPETVLLLQKIVKNLNGLTSLVFADYAETFGLSYYNESVKALEVFTQYSSSEFAVRPFIIEYPEKMMNQMLKWSKHKSEHVRRLSSEGCRPRLPWAMALPAFKKDPSPILPILENLKDDPSDYVRKSVANNLNDISKDNPGIVLDITKRWMGKSTNTDLILKHGCRTLLKQGNKAALEFFGTNKGVEVDVKKLKVHSSKIMIGLGTKFSFDIKLKEKQSQKLRLEYRIDFINASGKYSKKIFKISEIDFEPGETKHYERKLSFKNLTIRKHYPGRHNLALIVNGEEKESIKFNLIKE